MMKALLGVLICLVLAQSECFAISGGPDYGGSASVVGTYAGVMQAVFDPTNPLSSNSIGVFSVGVPTNGNASGPFVMFARGRVFSGTIQGTADPNKSTLKGVLNATFNYSISETETETSPTGRVTTHIVQVPVTASATGNLNTKISSSSSRSATGGSTMINGDATLFIEQGNVDTTTGEPVINDVIPLTVSGFRQSTTSSVSAGSNGTG